MPDLRQALKDFVATSNSGKYKDEQTLMSKFPELKGYDINVLKDFVATSNSGKYVNEDELFAKFPEFNLGTPMPSKKKEDTVSFGVSGSWESPTTPPKEEDDYFKGAFGNVLRGFDNVVPLGIGDFVDDMSRSVASGYRQSQAATAADRLLLKGTKASPEQLQKFINTQKQLASLTPSQEMQDYQKIYEEEGKGFWGVIKGLSLNPSVIPEVITSSLTAMATNADALTAGAAAVGTGATYGAGAGAAAGGVGAAPGAVAGAVASLPYAFGLASSVVEAGSTFGELLKEELGDKEMSKENVKAILEDPNKLQSIRNKAIARGLIIGTVDALTGKLASGVGAKTLERAAAKSATGAITRGAVVKSTAAGAGIEALGGMTGEAAARAAIGQDMDVSEIALEGLAELPGGIRSTIQARLAKPSYKVNGERVSAQDVDELINTMTPEQLSQTKFKIENDYEGRNYKIQDKIVTGQIRKEVIEANPNADEETINKLVGLEKELSKFENNKTQSGKDKASAIRSQIKNIQDAITGIPEDIAALNDDEEYIISVKTLDEIPEQFRDRAVKTKGDKGEVREKILGLPIGKKTTVIVGDGYRYSITGKEAKDYAIQKQGANESVLRTEQPEMGLQQMGEGNQEPQVVAAGTEEVITNEEQAKKEELIKALSEILPQNIDPLIIENSAKSINEITLTASEWASIVNENYKNVKHYNPDSAEITQMVKLIRENGLESLPGEITGKINERGEIMLVDGNHRMIALNEIDPNKKITVPIKFVKGDIKLEDYNLKIPTTLRPRQIIYEAYNKAKQDGSNPELIKTIEDLIAPKEQVSSKTPTMRVVVAPFFNTMAQTQEEAAAVRATPEYKAHIDMLNNLATQMGLEVDSISENLGGYENEAGEQVREVSNTVFLKNATIEQAEEYSALAAALAPQVQEASIAAQYVDQGIDTHNANEYSFKVSNIDAAIKALRAAKIYNFTVDESTNTVSFLDVFDFADPNLEDKIGNLIEQLENNNVTYEQQDFRPVESRFIDKGKRKKVLSRIKSKGSELGPSGQGVLQAVEQSVKRDAEFRGVKPEEYFKPERGNRLFNERLKEAADIAERYFKRVFGLERPKYYGQRKIDNAFAKRISDAFIAMAHDPNNPEVKAAYEALAKETKDQYQALIDAGYTVEINNTEPYANSQDMIDDLRNNKRIKIFSTEFGFGDTPITPEQRADNPLLQQSEYKDVNGQPLLINDLFRAIHDFFGHSELGNSFGKIGEENAWQVHARMFSPLARKAMTTETRGQNSFVNFSGVNDRIEKIRAEARKLRQQGKLAEAKAKVEEIYDKGSFAEQKIGLLPEEFYQIDESNVGDEDLIPVETLMTADTKDQTTLKRVYNFLDRLDSNLETFGRETAGMNVALPVMRAIIKTVKALVSTGITLQEAIKRAAAQNNVSEQDVVDSINALAEQRIRDVRKMFGKREKAAPKPEKLFGEARDTKTITMSEYELLKKQLRDEARGAKNAKTVWMRTSQALTKFLKTMVKGGYVSVKQTSAILRKFSGVNMFDEKSISKFVDYMEKVFNNADYAEQISKVNSMLRSARKNIQTKIGVAQTLYPLLKKLFAINPTLIPDSVFDKYVAIVSMMGERKTVLNLEEYGKVTDDVQEILDAVNEEVSKSEELAELFDAYDKKVVDENGKIDFAATLKQMVTDGTITEEEAAIMRKYKKDIVPMFERTPKSEAEIAAEKEALIAAIRDTDVDADGLPMKDERNTARELMKLIKTEAMQGLDNTQLKNLLKTIGNINNGYFSHYAELMVERLDAIDKSELSANSVKQANLLPISAIYSKLKGLLTKKDAISELIRRNPLYYIDQVFGDFKTKNLFNSLLEPSADAQAQFQKAVLELNNKLQKAEDAVARSFNYDANKALMSKFKMMTFMVQLENDSNPGNKQVNPAAEYLKATIEHIENGKSSFKEKDAKMLQKILDTYSDAEGNIDNEKLYNSFNSAEKNAIKTIQDINNELRDKAIYTAAVIRGDRIHPLDNYVHLNVLHEFTPDETMSGAAFVDDYNNSLRPSTKAKSLIARTGKVAPLNFDVFASANRGAKFTLMDYYLTKPIRTARKTLNETSKKLKEDKVSREKRDIFNAIDRAYEEAVRNLLTSNFTSTTIADDAVNFISKQGYRAVLASLPRFVGELSSNVAFALIAAPNDFALGVKNRGVVLSPNASTIMTNVGSKQTNRLFPHDTLSGRLVDTSILNEASGIRGGRAKSDVANKIQQIYNLSLKKYKNAVEVMADALIATPDKMVMRPMWFGSFANEFKNITGKDVDFDKIASNDEQYMAENKEAMDKARMVADDKTVLTGASENAFMGILKGTPQPNQGFFTRGFNLFNNFMTKFMIYEYVTARTGINAAIGNGSISRKQGAALLGAVTARMTLYTLLTTTLSNALTRMFVPDEDEDDDKAITQKLGQGLASSFTGILLGRDFGNVPKTFINYGIEDVNAKYLDFLREGEYDPYKDALQYTVLPHDKKGGKKGIDDFILNMTGPFSPAFKTLDLTIRKATEPPKKEEEAIQRAEKEKQIRIPLEILGNIGMIPLYKDVRKIVNAEIYKGLDRAEKKSETPMMSESDMKKYYPDLWQQLYGPGSAGYDSKQLKKEIQKEKEELRKELKDAMYDYKPK